MSDQEPTDGTEPDVAEAFHTMARESRPCILVQWLDGRIALYLLATGTAVEDAERRLLIVKQKNEEGDDQQDYRMVVPYEVLRGWYVYPRREIVHERVRGGGETEARCGFRGSRIVTEIPSHVNCPDCLAARVEKNIADRL